MRVMLQVSESDAKRARWIYTGIAYAALVTAVVWSLVDRRAAPQPSLTVWLSVGAAIWIGAIGRWWPTWPRDRLWAVVAYVGLLVRRGRIEAERARKVRYLSPIRAPRPAVVIIGSGAAR